MPVSVDCDQRIWRAAQNLANALADVGVTAENARALNTEGWAEVGTFAGVGAPNEAVCRTTTELLEDRERNAAAHEGCISHGG